ncbi:MAG: AAA family ATPase [Sulfurovum sp.]
MNEDNEKLFKEWLEVKGSANSTLSRYPLALKEKIPKHLTSLDENDYENLFECSDIDYLEGLYNRLLKNGDLYKFNIDTQAQLPSASVKKYIEFINENNSNTDKEIIHKIIMNTEENREYDKLVNLLFDKDSEFYHILYTQTNQKFKIIKSKKNNIVVIPFTDVATNMTISKGEINKTLNGNGNGNYKSYSLIIIDYLNGEKNINDIKQENSNDTKKERLDLNFSDIKKGNLNFQYKNILFKGVPGTGKSRAIDIIIDTELKIKGEKDNILRINIHSASSNADLMQGIGISTSAEGRVKYSEKQGLILDIIKRATFHPNQPFVLILEEIQENSLNELIGDLIYLIEEDKRAKDIEADGLEYSYKELVDKLIEEDSDISYIEIPYLVNDSTDYKKMLMPNNLFIFCTSNYRDDKKVIEDNLLRRFEVIEIYPNSEVANTYVRGFFTSLNESILKVMQENHETHPDRFMIGHSIWQNVENEKSFYKAFSKLVTEFKDIREVDFEIFKEILKDINFPKDIEIELKKHYFELIKHIQEKIDYGFIN